MPGRMKHDGCRICRWMLLFVILLFPVRVFAQAEPETEVALERFSLPDLSTMAGAEQYLEGLGQLLELFGAAQTPIKDCKVTPVGEQTYTGKSIRPVPKITYEGKTLKRGTDFTLKYVDNIKVGTAKITISGKGDYTGTKTVSFKIVRKSSSDSEDSAKNKTGSSGSNASEKKKNGSSGSDASGKKESSSKESASKKKFTVKLSKTVYTYNGKEHKPTVKVTLSGKSVSSSLYTVSYSGNKNVGKATVTVKGKGEHKGRTGTATFKIELPKISLSGCSSPSEGTVKISWKKAAQAQGYQIEYGTAKNFSGTVKKEIIRSGARQTCTLEKLTSGKTWYVRIRTYKKVGSSNWYSPWSTVRSVKVK